MTKIFFRRIVDHHARNNRTIGLVFLTHIRFLPITLPNFVPKRDEKKKLSQKILLVKFQVKMVITYFFRKSIETL